MQAMCTPSARGRVSRTSIAPSHNTKPRKITPARAIVRKDDFFASIVRDHILDGRPDGQPRQPVVVGVGTGDLVAGLLKYISSTESSGILFKSTSVSARQEISMYDLPADETSTTVDVFVDQADQVDNLGDEVWWVIGRGENGPQTCLVDVQAVKKAVTGSPKIVLLTRSADVGRLNGQIPVIIEADELDWEETAEEVDDLFVTDAEVTRRSHQEKANTRGFPDPVIVTNTVEGAPHMILDVKFYQGLRLFGEEAPYRDIQDEVESIDGVLAAGIVGVSRSSAAVAVHRVTDTNAGEFEVVTD